MEITKYLTSIGLSPNEQAVYLACLEIGESQITPITDRVEIPRTTIYYILEKLRDAGLIEIFQRNSRRVYKPTPPRQILNILKNRQEKMTEDIAAFTEALPEIANLYNESPFQPRIKVFKGKEIKKIYEDILESPIDQVCHVNETAKIMDLLGKSFVRKIIQRRADLRIHSRSIRIKSKGTDDPIFKSSAKLLRAVRFAPEGFECPAHILIYGNNIGFLTSTKESFGVILTSHDVAHSMQNWFEQLWKHSSKN